MCVCVCVCVYYLCKEENRCKDTSITLPAKLRVAPETIASRLTLMTLNFAQPIEFIEPAIS